LPDRFEFGQHIRLVLFEVAGRLLPRHLSHRGGRGSSWLPPSPRCNDDPDLTPQARQVSISIPN